METQNSPIKNYFITMETIYIDSLGKYLNSLADNIIIGKYISESVESKYDTDIYMTNKDKGIELIFDEDKKLKCIHFFGEKNDEYKRFNGILPLGLSFSNDKQTLFNKIGNRKIAEGGGDILPILGKSNYWCKFQFEECRVRFEFNDVDEITLVSLTQ
jgi:hypothetical protein